MKILDIIVYEGRNIYSHYPVIKVLLDLENLAGVLSNEIKALPDKLVAAIPTLQEHHCSKGRPGGFVERLYEGTYFGHIVEHVALELQHLAGYQAIYGKTMATDHDGIYEIVIEIGSPDAGIKAVTVAIELVEGLINGKELDLDQEVKNIQLEGAQKEFGPSTRAIIDACTRRGIPYFRLNDASLVQLGYGINQKRIQATITEKTNCIAVDIAGDKNLTKKMLQEIGIPVPEGMIVEREEDAVIAARALQGPVVVKPYNGNQGKGVSLNLTSEKEIRIAFSLAQNYCKDIMIERFVKGRQYRMVVVGGKVVAAAERIPPFVTGDGKSTIQELIDKINLDEQRGVDHEKPLTRIKVDAVVLLHLAKQHLTLQDILPEGMKVFLRESANLSTGGISVDVTDDVHPDNQEVAVRAAQRVGLDIAGVDLVLPDISKSIYCQDGAVIEINAAPGIRMHHYPSKGQPRDVGKAIVDWLFPPGATGRIPIAAVTGTNGKTTTTRMISHILALSGHQVGTTTTDGIYVADKCIMRGDMTGPRSAKVILQHPQVTAAVLETARGGLIRGGLAFDYADVGVITNISDDHLGQDGIDTLEDLAQVKSLVIEAVHKNGYVVLNADDPLTAGLAQRVKGQIIYFSVTSDNIVIKRHLGIGGNALFIKRGYLVWAQGDKVTKLAVVKQLPCTVNGKAEHNVVNALAAAAAAVGLGVSPGKIKEGLMSFGLEESHNPGRLMLRELNGIKVIIDYGHNAAAYESMLSYAKKLRPKRLIGVIGVPGDRNDESILKVGQIAGCGFHQIIIKEDQDLRGRAPGQVAVLLYQGALSAGLHKDRIAIIHNELGALKQALGQGQPGDVIIVFYEKLEPILRFLDSFPTGDRQVRTQEVKTGLAQGLG